MRWKRRTKNSGFDRAMWLRILLAFLLLAHFALLLWAAIQLTAICFAWAAVGSAVALVLPAFIRFLAGATQACTWFSKLGLVGFSFSVIAVGYLMCDQPELPLKYFERL